MNIVAYTDTKTATSVTWKHFGYRWKRTRSYFSIYVKIYPKTQRSRRKEAKVTFILRDEKALTVHVCVMFAASELKFKLFLQWSQSSVFYVVFYQENRPKLICSSLSKNPSCISLCIQMTKVDYILSENPVKSRWSSCSFLINASLDKTENPN